MCTLQNFVEGMGRLVDVDAEVMAALVRSLFQVVEVVLASIVPGFIVL